MTDGRAITGMTADSHARSDIPAFFSLGISIFPDRAEPVFEIEVRQAMSHFASRYLREISVSPRFFNLFSPSVRTCTLSTERLRSVRLSLRAFGFLRFSVRFFNNYRLPRSFPVSYPPSLLFLSFSFRRLHLHCSTCSLSGTLRPGIRICIGKSSARRRIRSSQISIFRWTECLRYWQSEAIVSEGRTRSFRAAARVVNSRAIARSRL